MSGLDNTQTGNDGSANAPQDAITTKQEHAFFTPDMRKGVTPTPGNTYIITDQDYRHIISLRNGRVEGVDLATAKPNPGMGGCYLWHCEDKNGWIVFRNAVDGKYLGRRYYSRTWETGDWEESNYQQFLPSICEGGGWILLAYDRRGGLVKISAQGTDGGMTGILFSDLATKPTVWGFVEVPFDQ